MQRKALFVGINDYEGGLTPLSCACNDANDLCDYFRDQLGYDTYVLRNADILKIRKKITEVTAELQKGDVFLFFFAGHGFTVDKGENNDRRLATARDLKDHLEEGEGGISLRRLKKLTKGGYSRIFILDACQTKIDTTNQTRSVDNLEMEKFRSRDLSIISSIVGTKSDVEDVAPLLVINSCNVGDVAYELERNGLFTWAFLEMLSKMKDNGEVPVFNAKLVEHIAVQMQSHPGRFRQTPVFFTSDETIPGISVFSETSVDSHEAATSTLVMCPVCGKKNQPENTFRCRECGRDNLCIRHQDETTFLCPDCAAKKKRKVTDDAEQIINESEELSEYESEGTGCEKKFQTMSTCATLSCATLPSHTTCVKLKKGDLLLGRYKVLAELGQGGMGIVYKCYDEIGDAFVAVKGLPPEVSHDSASMEDIRNNFKLVSELRHPNIVGIRNLEADSYTGDYYLIMDLALGKNLRRWAKTHQGQEHLQTKFKIIVEIAETLDYVHGHRIIHRDIKPENVMLDECGHILILDFGIAAPIDINGYTCPNVHSKAGTSHYKSPEQWRGVLQNAAADQYSLGVVTYELIAGHLPFNSSDEATLRKSVLSEPIPLIQGVSKQVNAALARALSKNPSGRFASCVEFARALG